MLQIGMAGRFSSLLNSNDLFDQTSIYHGIYRDDGIVFFKGKWSNNDIVRWLNTFQIRVNNLCGSNGLVFTAEIWRHNNNVSNIITKLTEKISIVERKYFPFLYVSLFWNFHNKLSFKIHMKPNQNLKYINRGSLVVTQTSVSKPFQMEFLVDYQN